MKNKINLTIGLFLLVFVTGACVDMNKLFPQSQIVHQQTPATAQAVEQTPTPTDESEELKEKIEELEKKIDETEKKTTQPPIIIREKTDKNVKKTKVPTIRDSKSNAQVNSPGDGFLAMRSQPDTETGYRILQIPHRTNVSVLGCQGFKQRVGGRSGRWCRVSFAGKTGWVFDGWLVYVDRLK